MAKYPVTHAQFEAFLTAEDGYRNKEWWQGIQRSEESSVASWKEANSPRERASWCDAVAFCRWLSHRTESKIRLPTEWEWQQAASGGAPMREYPWSAEWDVNRCNGLESQLHRTTAVGMYPRGATKQGAMDMAGNVWEWCQNEYENPERPEAVHIDNKGGQRVARGGSWCHLPGLLRASTRSCFTSDTRLQDIGFRLVQDIP